MTLCIKCKNFGEKNVKNLFSAVAAKRAKDKDLFYNTHTKITLLKTSDNFDLLEKEQEVDENQLVRNITSHTEGNRCFVIGGETGTGKSEVCVYVSLRLREKNRIVVSLRKDASLIDVIETIIEEIRSYVTDKRKLIDIRKWKANLTELREKAANKQGSLAIAKIVTGSLLDNHDVSKKEIPSYQKFIDSLEELLIKNIPIIGKKTNLSGEKDIVLINPEDIDNYKLRNLYHKKNILNKSDAKLAEEINSEIWEILTTKKEFPNINTLLRTLQSTLVEEGHLGKDERICIIFEDFAVTALDREKLLRFIEDDDPDNRWDFLLAATTDRINELKEVKTRADRFHFYRTNKILNKPMVTFLDENSAAEFIKKYMKEIYRVEKAPCDACGYCPDKTKKIFFPFTKNLLNNLYKSLNETQKKPRVIIKIIRSLLIEMCHDNPPQKSLSSNIDDSNLKVPTSISENYKDDIRNFLSWYSEKTQNGYFFPCYLLKGLGIKETQLTSLSKLDDEKKCIVSSNDNDEDHNIKNRNETPPPEIPISNIETQFTETLKDKLDQKMQYENTWRATKEIETSSADIQKFNANVKDGILSIINKFSDKGTLYSWKRGYSVIFHNMDLKLINMDKDLKNNYTYYIDKNILTPKAVRCSIAIKLLKDYSKRDEYRESEYKRIISKKLNEYNFILLNELGINFPQSIILWSRSVKDEYTKYFKSGAYKLSLPDYISALVCFLVLLESPMKKHSLNSVYTRYQDSNKPIKINEKIYMACHSEAKDALDKILEYQTEFFLLFTWFWTFNGTMLSIEGRTSLEKHLTYYLDTLDTGRKTDADRINKSLILKTASPSKRTKIADLIEQTNESYRKIKDAFLSENRDVSFSEEITKLENALESHYDTIKKLLNDLDKFEASIPHEIYKRLSKINKSLTEEKFDELKQGVDIYKHNFVVTEFQKNLIMTQLKGDELTQDLLGLLSYKSKSGELVTEEEIELIKKINVRLEKMGDIY